MRADNSGKFVLRSTLSLQGLPLDVRWSKVRLDALCAFHCTIAEQRLASDGESRRFFSPHLFLRQNH